jgi:hypothetical protein
VPTVVVLVALLLWHLALAFDALKWFILLSRRSWRGVYGFRLLAAALFFAGLGLVLLRLVSIHCTLLGLHWPLFLVAEQRCPR